MWELFFEFDYSVPLFGWQWIVSQILLGVLIVCIIIGWQQKDKVKLMKWQVGFNFLAAAANAFLFNWIVVAIGLVGGIRQIAFIMLEIKRRNRVVCEKTIIQSEKEIHKKRQREFSIGFSIFLFFTVVNIVTIYFTMQNYYGFVIMAGRIAINFVMWKGTSHAIKIMGAFIWPVIMIVNQLMFFSFIGMAKEVITIGTVIVFYIRFFNKKRAKSVLEKA